MTHHLYLFQIGPVQSFIAAARRTQDLYVGSRLLSMIASAGARAALQAGAELIFPAVDAQGNLPSSVPHRFAFISPREDVAAEVETALHEYWREAIAGTVRRWLGGLLSGDAGWTAIFERQVASWLEVYWVGVPYDPARHSTSYQQAGRLMAARKAARHFVQVDEPGEKCTLTGAQSALPLDWRALKRAIGDPDDRILRPNERLGALAIIKRFAQQAGVDLGVDIRRVKSFPSMNDIAGVPEEDTETPAYLAILHMDGDRMGLRLGDANMTLDKHRALSLALALFAETTVPQIIDDLVGMRGALVYAGGDDVLALIPLERVLACAEEIRKAFADKVGGAMSAGIAIMAANTPFDSALEEARLAEKRAKAVFGRDAVVVRDVRSSAIREAGANWSVANDQGTSSLIEVMGALQDYFGDDRLSGKLGYDLLAVAHNMGGDVPGAARRAEVGRLIRRRSMEGELSAAEQSALAADLTQIGEVNNRWESLANWTILARFLSKGGRRG